MNILITGGTGLIGQRLTKHLSTLKMFPRLLSRKEDLKAIIPRYKWDLQNGTVDKNSFDEVDVIIHLAGANIAEGRWTSSRKKEILASRIDSTRLLFSTIEKLKKKPTTFICASATGYYGFQDYEHESTEDENPGTDFLAQVCQKWEAEADRFETFGMRVVKVRTGVVFDQSGGALQKMAQPIRLCAGAALGSGKQIIPWIHWEDWCGALTHLLQQNNLSGAYNLTAPQPVTNAELTRLIAKVIGRPLVLPNVPAFILKLLLGEMSSVVLQGNKISSEKLTESGFEFKHSATQDAIRELLSQD